MRPLSPWRRSEGLGAEVEGIAGVVRFHGAKQEAWAFGELFRWILYRFCSFVS